jgi:adenylate kinase family enzyme
VCLCSTPHTPHQLEFIINNIRLLGKGTQCGLLVEEFNFSHLSAGDLLRAEQDRPGSEDGKLIRKCIREGDIVPMEVTVRLLENAMHTALQSKSGSGWEDGKGRFLIDGFPRKMDQALKFEEDVRSRPSHLFLWSYFVVDEPCDLFLGVPVVPGTVFHDGRGDYVEALAETRRDQR